jgi:hypothetical protein
MKPRAIELHIRELRLHGFAPADRRRIGAALERELTRLLSADALPERLAASTEVPSLPPARYRAPAGAPASAVGVAVARAVHGSLLK